MEGLTGLYDVMVVVRVCRRLFSTRRQDVRRVGDNGRSAVHCVHLAHGDDLRRPLLLHAFPATLPTHTHARLRRCQDRFCLDRIHRNLLAAGDFRISEPTERVSRGSLCPRCAGIRNLRVDICVLRASGADVCVLCAYCTDTGATCVAAA